MATEPKSVESANSTTPAYGVESGKWKVFWHFPLSSFHLLVAHHDVGDHVEDFAVAAAAAGGAVGHLLDILEGLQNVFKAGLLMQGIQNVPVADLLAVAYHVVFLHMAHLSFFCFIIARNTAIVNNENDS